MSDRPDDALTSEELIRRAREGLGTPDSAPEAFDEIPSSSENRLDPAPSPPLPPVVPAPAPPAEGSDDGGSLLPEHFRPEHGTPPGAGGTGTRSGFKWLRWIIPAGVLGFVLFNFLTADTSVDDLGVGDCFLNPSDIEITTVETVECAELHDYEVFAFIQLNDRPGGFPGDDLLFDEAGDKCFEPFLAYTGLDSDAIDSEYLYDVFIPGRSSWDDGGRESMCAVYAVDTEYNPVSSLGSARSR